MSARGKSFLWLGCLALVQCAESDDTINQVDARVDARAEAAVDARPDASDVVVPPDAPRPVGDAVPSGAVSFFRGTQCPRGWTTWTDGAGRTLLPMPQGGTRGGLAGTSLTSGEQRTHTHLATAMLTAPAVSFAGAAGSSNHLGSAGSAPVTLAVASADATLPYVQMLACRKSDEADPLAAPPPRGIVQFFDRSDCPTGWSEAVALRGRLVVGVPAGGTAGASYGGAALMDREVRSHAHALHATVMPHSQGIALASGCCADGYAQNVNYTVTATTEAESAAPPYVQLLACSPQ